jgi:pimeloyl-ACP methyl ester carboxylesterase
MGPRPCGFLFFHRRVSIRAVPVRRSQHEGESGVTRRRIHWTRRNDMLKTMLTVTVALGATCAAQNAVLAQGPRAPAPAAASPKVARATIKGIAYAYQVHGQGEPLLLLHGGLGSSDMFEPLLPTLGANRQLIAVDLQGHGRTPLGTRPIRCQAIADDLATLLKQLGHRQVDVMGYSFGGCVALRLAVQHPDVVRRLALVSTPFADDGWYAEMKPQQAAVSRQLFPMMKETPMYKSYAAVAPKVDEFPKLLDAMGELMRQKYDWSADVAKLAGTNVGVMLVYGDADMTRPEHEVKFYQLLGGGLHDAGWGREHMSRNRLAIIPDATHYDIFTSPHLAETVRPFLDGKTNTKTWADQVKEQAPPRK